MHATDETPHNYGLERETSQPKGRTRWNPKPEQIRILEAIFQSGVVSPPREEIKRIRAQLEVFGQVGDVNVYYWFQNRKSRSKRKPRLPAAQRSKSRTQSGTLSSTSSTSTSTSVHSKTTTEISNSAPSSMQKNIGGQYFSPSPVPVYDIHAVYEEMSKTSTSAPSSNPPTGDQYCFSSAPPVYSSAGNHYNLHTSTSVPYETLPNPSNCAPSAMPDNIEDQYCFSSAAPIGSSAGHHNDLRTMSYNMQAIGAAAAGTQSILNEGTCVTTGSELFCCLDMTLQTFMSISSLILILVCRNRNWNWRRTRWLGH